MWRNPGHTNCEITVPDCDRVCEACENWFLKETGSIPGWTEQKEMYVYEFGKNLLISPSEKYE
jgi:hypothetical protein